MLPAQYTEESLKTEARDFGPVVERFKDPAIAALTFQLFNQVTELSNVLDLVKKTVFYGKQIEEISEAKSLALVEASNGEVLDVLQIAQNTITTDVKNIRLLHSILGMTSEVGELITCFMEGMAEGKEMDLTNFKEELSDFNWYMAVGMDAVGSSYEEVWTINVEKLKKRYAGQKFTEEAAINRDVVSERRVMDEVSSN